MLAWNQTWDIWMRNHYLSHSPPEAAHISQLNFFLKFLKGILDTCLGHNYTKYAQWAILGGHVGGSILYIKSLNYVLVYYSLSFLGIKQVF